MNSDQLFIIKKSHPDRKIGLIKGLSIMTDIIIAKKY